MFYSNMNINGSVFPLAVNITGEGAPTTSTEANVGMLYMDTLTGALYKRTQTGWVLMGASKKVITLSADLWAGLEYVYANGEIPAETDGDVEVSVAAVPDMMEEYCRCGVYPSTQEAGVLTFKAMYDKPTIDLDVVLRITKGGA